MDGVYNIDNMVAKIAREHQIITKYVAEFNNRYKTKDKEFFKGIASFFDFMEKDLLDKGKKIEEVSRQELDKLWVTAKKQTGPSERP